MNHPFKRQNTIHRKCGQTRQDHVSSGSTTGTGLFGQDTESPVLARAGLVRNAVRTLDLRLISMGKLDNKVAIVTGATSGMGKEIARLFAQEGASVVAIARRKEMLQDVIDEITVKGGKAVAVTGDVTKEEDVRNAVKTAVQQSGRARHCRQQCRLDGQDGTGRRDG